MFSALESFYKVVIFGMTIVVAIPCMLLLNVVRHPARERMAQIFHTYCCMLFRVEVAVRGEVSAKRPTLFVANHVSYLDILVLGSLTKGLFVAKKEIESWPFFGFMSDLQRTIYVERLAHHAAGQRDELSDRVLAHENIILFPEGTSGDGNRVLPFKSALFSVADIEVDGEPLLVQPVSITYPLLDGIPLGRHLKPLVAWYGDMELLPHAWKMLGLGRLTAAVQFHEPVTCAEFGSRKELARYCTRVVAQGVAKANSGKWREDPRLDDFFPCAPDSLVPSARAAE